jgi:3-oxoadipate enol-lactonase
MSSLLLPWGSQHYRVDGKPGAPWVVLCHALGTDHTLWETQSRALAADYRVLRYDLRGHGQSDAPDSAYTLRELASDLLALLDALGIERTHVGGISIGGMVAMALAAISPRRVHRLVLANTAPRIASAEVWSERIGLVRQNGLEPLVESSLVRWFSEPFRAREPAVVASYGQLLSKTRLLGYAGCCAALRDGDLTLLLHSIHAPSLVVAGKHDPVTTPSHGRALAAGIAGASYVELEAGHLSNVEAGSAFNASMLAFFTGSRGSDSIKGKRGRTHG